MDLHSKLHQECTHRHHQQQQHFHRQQRAGKAKQGGVEHVSPGDTDSTGPSTSASPGNPVMEHAPEDTAPQLDNIGDLSDQVLASDQVRAALQGEVSFNHETTSAR